jgi:hypothetical protein
MDIRLEEAYRRRPVRFLDYWRLDGWTLKVYGIAYQGERPGDALLAAARQVAATRLQQSAADSNHYHLGFVGIHQGKTGNFVFVDWWADENELHHHVYVSPADNPEALEYRTPSGLSACVWDLRVIGHEREAWLQAVLKAYPQPDGQAYLTNVLNADV